MRRVLSPEGIRVRDTLSWGRVSKDIRARDTLGVVLKASGVGAAEPTVQPNTELHSTELHSTELHSTERAILSPSHFI